MLITRNFLDSQLKFRIHIQEHVIKYISSWSYRIEDCHNGDDEWRTVIFCEGHITEDSAVNSAVLAMENHIKRFHEER
jgi:hypothetical protein